jgi:hypothetical protein
MVMDNSKCVVLVVVWDDVCNEESVTSFEVLADKIGEIFMRMIVIEPVSKLINHFIKYDGVASILAGCEMVNIFVVALATWAVVGDSFLPF